MREYAVVTVTFRRLDEHGREPLSVTEKRVVPVEEAQMAFSQAVHAVLSADMRNEKKRAWEAKNIGQFGVSQPWLAD